MSDPKYLYPVVILIEGRGKLMPIDTVLGVVKVLIETSENLYFPLLPEHSDSKKVMYPLKKMTGMWSSEEIQKAVRLGYKELDKSTTKRCLQSRDRQNWMEIKE